MKKPRFLIIAWPEDHDENLENHANDIQDVLDCDMGCPQVLPIPPFLEQAIQQAMSAQLKDI